MAATSAVEAAIGEKCKLAFHQNANRKMEA